jgi:hypothetical protein
MGVSGVVSPRGLVWHQVYTSGRMLLTFDLPLEPRIRTLYSAVGARAWGGGEGGKGCPGGGDMQRKRVRGP